MRFAVCFVIFSVFSPRWCDGEEAGIGEAGSIQVRHVIRTMIRGINGMDRKLERMAVLSSRSGPTVRASTKLGPVDGLIVETCRRRRKYAAFLGMPYGKPPIGALRFKAPVPADPWDGAYDGTFERPSCMQFNGPVNSESEDCLYINVYTPAMDKETTPKPVMVFIHGGAFISGSSNFSVYAPDLFIESDVVLVTFNYRLGALGFLSLQTADIPGNAGLKDQRLALEWVRDNIKGFGGDPNSITIFGESAGAASVTYHILSSSSKGLFHKAIMESGAATSPWAFMPARETVKLATALAKKLGCPVSEQAMVDCLRKVSPYKITEEQEKSLTLADILTVRPFAFIPTTEPNVNGAFLTRDPVDILTSKAFHPVPSIIGFNSREGLILLPLLKTLDPLNIAVNLFSYNLWSVFPSQAKSSFTDKEKNYLNSALRNFYSNVKPVGTFNSLKMSDIVTDVAFMVPIQYVASVLTNTSQPVYNYIFTYDGEYGYYKKNLNIKENGVCHGDELGYLFYESSFRWSVNETRYNEAEQVANTLIGLWTNFAKTGNPSSKWPARTQDKVIYAEIGKEFRITPEFSVGLDDRYKFWAKLIREITKK